jgi:hypothetical protein
MTLEPPQNALFVDQRLSMAKPNERQRTETRTIAGRTAPDFSAEVICKSGRRFDSGSSAASRIITIVQRPRRILKGEGADACWFFF